MLVRGGKNHFAGSSQAQFQLISPVKFIWDAISSLRYREVLKKMTSFKDGILPSNNVSNLSMMGAVRDANTNWLNLGNEGQTEGGATSEHCDSQHHRDQSYLEPVHISK
jgi:hypothetical protein